MLQQAFSGCRNLFQYNSGAVLQQGIDMADTTNAANTIETNENTFFSMLDQDQELAWDIGLSRTIYDIESMFSFNISPYEVTTNETPENYEARFMRILGITKADEQALELELERLLLG